MNPTGHIVGHMGSCTRAANDEWLQKLHMIVCGLSHFLVCRYSISTSLR